MGSCPAALLALMLFEVVGGYQRLVHHPSFRVHNGRDDNGEHPYVVVIAELNKEPLFRACTGSLIAREWVLTAAHCIKKGKQNSNLKIFYSDLKKMPNATFSRKASKGFPHPGFHREHSYRNDIGLLLIEKLSAIEPGRISAVDYLSLTGRSVKYIGGGSTKLNANNTLFDDASPRDFKKSDFKRPLQVGDAVIEKCEREGSFLKNYFKYLSNDALWICLRPQSVEGDQRVEPADSGGPVIFNNKIIGICSCAFGSQFMFTAVSPYLDWIQDTIKARELAENAL